MSAPFPGSHPLFSRFGVELEYMIVNRETLDIAPIADQVLVDEAGEVVEDLEFEGIGWSNELALHVIELKTPEPVKDFSGLAEAFSRSIVEIDRRLRPLGAMLLPTAMHPWMRPLEQSKLWPHGNREIYKKFDQIFDCRGHGWTNLQSSHLNLPFANEEEFVRLHAAIRLVLPLIPALSASSPFAEGEATGWLDYRLEVYRSNCIRMPSVTGSVVPEIIRSHQDYHDLILEPIYRDLAPHDPEGILRDEWANARGAIARFHRGAIEIRVIDVQEHPAQDLRILGLIVDVLRGLTLGGWSELETQHSVPTEELKSLLFRVAREGGGVACDLTQLLSALGLESSSQGITVLEVWKQLAHRVGTSADWLSEGNLSERILKRLPARPGPGQLRELYRRLAQQLVED